MKKVGIAQLVERIKSLRKRSGILWMNPKRKLPEEFYHIQKIDKRGRLFVHVYKRLGQTERLQNISGLRPVQLLSWRLTRARTVLKTPSAGFTEISPKVVPEQDFSVYVVQHGRVKDLQLDPKDWLWSRVGHIKGGNFYLYTTKRGYRVILSRQGKTPPFNTQMANRGYSANQCRTFYKDLWHKWIPRKISTMVWLTCQGGLPLAE
jgi:hypothetical protein